MKRTSRIFFAFWLLICVSDTCSVLAQQPSENIADELFHIAGNPSCIIVLPTSDCYKCIAPLTVLMDKWPKDALSKSTLVTDNYVYGKDFLDKNGFTLKLLVNKELTNRYAIGGRTALYLQEGVKVRSYKLTELTEKDMIAIGSKIVPPAINATHVELKDSLFTPGSFEASKIGSSLVLFDPTIQRGLILSDSGHRYFQPGMKFDIMKNLVLRFNSKISSDQITLERQRKFNKSTGIADVSIKAIRYDNHKLYYFFNLNYVYPAGKDSSVIGTEELIGIKTLSSATELENIGDLDDIQEVIRFSSITEGGKKFYPHFSYSEYSSSLKVERDTLYAKVFGEDNTEGLAILRFEKGKLTAVKVDTKVHSGDRFGIIRNKHGLFVCSVTDNHVKNKTALIKEDDHYFYNQAAGLTYLHFLNSGDDTVSIVSVKKDDGIHRYKIALLTGLIVDDVKLPFDYFPDILIPENHNVIAITKQMVDENYNYGILKVERKVIPQ